jgi:hypothetical protein
LKGLLLIDLVEVEDVETPEIHEFREIDLRLEGCFGEIGHDGCDVLGAPHRGEHVRGTLKDRRSLIPWCGGPVLPCLEGVLHGGLEFARPCEMRVPQETCRIVGNAKRDRFPGVHFFPTDETRQFQGGFPHSFQFREQAFPLGGTRAIGHKSIRVIFGTIHFPHGTLPPLCTDSTRGVDMWIRNVDIYGEKSLREAVVTELSRPAMSVEKEAERRTYRRIASLQRCIFGKRIPEMHRFHGPKVTI